MNPSKSSGIHSMITRAYKSCSGAEFLPLKYFEHSWHLLLSTTNLCDITQGKVCWLYVCMCPSVCVVQCVSQTWHTLDTAAETDVVWGYYGHDFLSVSTAGVASVLLFPSSSLHVGVFFTGSVCLWGLLRMLLNKQPATHTHTHTQPLNLTRRRSKGCRRAIHLCSPQCDWLAWCSTLSTCSWQRTAKRFLGSISISRACNLRLRAVDRDPLPNLWQFDTNTQTVTSLLCSVHMLDFQAQLH